MCLRSHSHLGVNMKRVGGVLFRLFLALILVFGFQSLGVGFAAAAAAGIGPSPGTALPVGPGPVGQLGMQPPLVELVLAPVDGAVTLGDELAGNATNVLQAELDALSQLLGGGPLGGGLGGVGTFAGTTAASNLAVPIAARRPVAEIVLAPIQGAVGAARDVVRTVTAVVQAELDAVNRLAGGVGTTATANAVPQPFAPVGSPGTVVPATSPIIALLLAPVRNTVTIGNSVLGALTTVVGGLVGTPSGLIASVQSGGIGAVPGALVSLAQDLVTTVTDGLSQVVGTVGAVAQADLDRVSIVLGASPAFVAPGSTAGFQPNATTTLAANTAALATPTLVVARRTGVLLRVVTTVMRVPQALVVGAGDLTATTVEVASTLVGSVVTATGEVLGATPAPRPDLAAATSLATTPSETTSLPQRIGQAANTLATGLTTAVNEGVTGLRRTATDVRAALRPQRSATQAFVGASAGTQTTALTPTGQGFGTVGVNGAGTGATVPITGDSTIGVGGDKRDTYAASTRRTQVAGTVAPADRETTQKR